MKIKLRKFFLPAAALFLFAAWLAWPLYRPFLWTPLQNIPPADILTPQQALERFEVAEGYAVDLIAHEPLIESPVVIRFDPAGNIWVCEMNTYMTDADGSEEGLPIGRIVMLQDNNGDQVMDTRTVILDDIVLPRALAFVPGGFLYADQEQLYYAQTQGNEVINRVVVDSKYAEGGDVEHKANALVYGLDNWLYSANAFQRYRFYPAKHPVDEDLEIIYRDDNWVLVKELTQFRGQWGLSVDDYGRLVYNHNHTAAYYDYLRPNSLRPIQIEKQDGSLRAKTGEDRFELGSRQVFPIRVTLGVNLGYKYGVLDRDSRLKRFTAAGGPAVYRGNHLPQEAYGVVFVTEPAANLVTARRAVVEEGSIRGEHLLEGKDILASTDERFRPVHVANAPDGSLYIVDMYRGISQHVEHMTNYLYYQILDRGLEEGITQGRIYRLRHATNKLGNTESLGEMTSAELVDQLAHPNGWQRDEAKRLLIERQDKSVIPALEQVARNHNDHRAQILALWTLEGLQGLSLETIRASFDSKHIKVKVNALAVGEFIPAIEQTDFNRFLEAAATSELDYELALQLALSASRARVMPVLEAILISHGDKPFIKLAAASGFSSNDAFNAYRESGVEQLATDLNTEKEPLFSEAEKSQIIAGEALYFGRARCLGCHGAEGAGISGVAPPLNHSEWVLESEEQLVAILLHGLTGPVTVNGTHYKLPGDMPGLARDKSFSDADIAALASYLRNAWDNRSSIVPVKVATRVRTATKGRSSPFTSSELKSDPLH